MKKDLTCRWGQKGDNDEKDDNWRSDFGTFSDCIRSSCRKGQRLDFDDRLMKPTAKAGHRLDPVVTIHFEPLEDRRQMRRKELVRIRRGDDQR